MKDEGCAGSCREGEVTGVMGAGCDGIVGVNVGVVMVGPGPVGGRGAGMNADVGDSAVGV